MEILDTQAIFHLVAASALITCATTIYAARSSAELRPSSLAFLFSKGSELHKAAREGQLATLRRLIEQDEHDIETESNSFRMTPLFWAVYGEQEQAIEYLLSKDANFDHIDSFGRTPIFYVSDKGNTTRATAVVQCLAKYGANLEAPARRTVTPLLTIIAASTRSNNLPLALARRGAKPLIEKDNDVLRVAFFRGQSHDKRMLLRQLLPRFRRETCEAARTRAQCINALLQAQRIPNVIRQIIWEMELPWNQHILTDDCAPPS